MEEKALINNPDTKEEIIEEATSEVKKLEEDVSKNNEALTANKISNGYELFAHNSSISMTIFDSGVKNVFIVKGKDAIVYKKDDIWIYSETNEANLVTKIMDIKF